MPGTRHRSDRPWVCGGRPTPLPSGKHAAGRGCLPHDELHPDRPVPPGHPRSPSSTPANRYGRPPRAGHPVAGAEVTVKTARCARVAARWRYAPVLSVTFPGKILCACRGGRVGLDTGE
jgi:hypothetical protein